MNKDLYNMIFKRKSFHLFRNIGNEHITAEELKNIEQEFTKLKPLVDDINVKIRIVKDEATCQRGQEYCLLFYSEKKDNYLQNIGYLGEQLDLYLVSKNIGTLWFGIGTPTEKQYEGLDFVIMMAIAKIDSPDKFRKDMFKSKRKSIEEIWTGSNFLEIANIARFAPSSCNTEPWQVESTKDTLKVYRYSKVGKRGIMPKNMVTYYNQIDIGIFLCFLELCLIKENIIFNRTLFKETDINNEKNLTATYKVLNQNRKEDTND